MGGNLDGACRPPAPERCAEYNGQWPNCNATRCAKVP
jgi:hypothetical protein